MKPVRIFVSALEYSANLHLLKFLNAFKEKNIPFVLCGIFDSKVLKGYTSTYNPSVFRVMGFSGILKLIPKFLTIQKELAKLASSCDIALFMDSSSFNIPLIKNIRKICQKHSTNPPYIVYYILPQVWAWKAYRAKVLSRICDSLWGILPFEWDFYPKNTPICYVGHPLLDTIPYSLNARQDSKKIAFMPGSRKAEIRALFPIFKTLAQMLKDKGKIPLLIIPKTFENKNLSAIYGNLSDFEIAFDTYEGLKDCSFAFVCSGTATLESTLLGIPTILAYKTRMLDYYIAKTLVKLNFIGLANIFLEFCTYKSPKNNPNPKNPPIHPEFLQSLVTPQNLLYAYENYNYTHFFAQKAKLQDYLQHGSAQNCATNLENLIKNLQK
ncbi:lipid-A-disaccharide synthase [Helicobacter turcicus]|uniref:Lipid-A-disaccharide synthase n=1 Tax=Helicobacter turcicus TaxID=2867412 RepID=A0ABS7JNC3_9HELI|nr:lipid-A-disaccharide synthase [Helicobacter turcicus]MBX7490900.1 lipid-A-disaccharide synthase [Helicobacter turcicus]MBX7545754.1 lipid-A-disaccharide synthase [Helicobacter turcicus]